MSGSLHLLCLMLMTEGVAQGGPASAGWRGILRALLVILAVAAVAVLATFPARSARAAAHEVMVRVAPSEVTLSTGDAATVDVMITNTTAGPVRVSAFDIRVPARVTAERIPPPTTIRPIRANGFVLTTFVLRAHPGIEDGEVNILVEVKSSSSKNVPSDQLITSSLALKAGTISHLPDVAFASFPDKLNDGQSAAAALRISNPTPFTFHQIQVTVVDSQDVTLVQMKPVMPPFVPCPAGTASAVGCLAMLAPGETEVLYLRAQANREVQTGVQHVSVVVASSTNSTSVPITSSVVTTTPVQVTIFGVDALTPFGLGTLFVLPGLLTVLTFLLLARYVYPRSKALPDTVQFSDPRTLLFIVPPAALAYLVVLAAWGVNLTRQAGTLDVAILFSLGVALGVLMWMAAGLIYYAYSGRKQFKADDLPEKVLQRLEARHASLSLPTAIAGDFSYLYLSDGPDDKLFACSPAKYAFTDDAADPARTRFRQALARDDIGAVRGAVGHKEVRLRWQLPTGVTLLDRSAVQFQAATALVTEGDPLDDD
jgi:hypothetical protein